MPEVPPPILQLLVPHLWRYASPTPPGLGNGAPLPRIEGTTRGVATDRRESGAQVCPRLDRRRGIADLYFLGLIGPDCVFVFTVFARRGLVVVSRIRARTEDSAFCGLGVRD